MSVLFPRSLGAKDYFFSLGPSLTLVSEYNAILNLLSESDFFKTCNYHIIRRWLFYIDVMF